MAHLYSEENIPFPTVEKLRGLGHDVLTAQEAGQANQRIPDEQVLVYAIQLNRAVLTHNRWDYIRLHTKTPNHCGIVVCSKDRNFNLNEHLEDLRFIVPVQFTHRADLSDDEIRKLAEAEHQEMLKGHEIVNRLVKLFDAMIGKPAPALPMEGWVGGKRPELAGKDYLLRYWSTSCGPCKNDLPALKRLEDSGATIIGLHPHGTPAEEVEKQIRAAEFTHPTFLAANKNGDSENPTIGSYPAIMFPYYILVDAKGQVIAHGGIAEMLEKKDILLGR